MGYIMEALYNYLFLLPIFIVSELLLYKYYKAKGINMKLGAIITYQFLMLLLTAMLSITGVSDITDLVHNGANWISMDEINFIPFIYVGTSNFSGLFLNIVLFVPLGVMIPLLWKKGTSLLRTTFIGFLLSLLIEVSQLFNWRATDIDDLLMNTLGTIIGYLLYVVFLTNLTMLQENNDKPSTFIQNSALITILFTFVVYFCLGSPLISFIWNAIY